MPKLGLDLQEGFTGDVVSVRVNGRESFRKEGVTTRRMLGLAVSSEIEVPEGTATIEIRIPTKNLSKTITLETATSIFLGVSVGSGEIEHIVSREPFGYA